MTPWHKLFWTMAPLWESKVKTLRRKLLTTNVCPFTFLLVSPCVYPEASRNHLITATILVHISEHKSKFITCSYVLCKIIFWQLQESSRIHNPERIKVITSWASVYLKGTCLSSFPFLLLLLLWWLMSPPPIFFRIALQVYSSFMPEESSLQSLSKGLAWNPNGYHPCKFFLK